MKDGFKTTGAVALATSGFGAAFSLAACCAIPFLLAGTGIGMTWLAPIVAASQPYTMILSAFALAALVGSVVLVWFTRAHCQPGSRCAHPAFRWIVTAGAGIGAILLLLSKTYA